MRLHSREEENNSRSLTRRANREYSMYKEISYTAAVHSTQPSTSQIRRISLTMHYSVSALISIVCQTSSVKGYKYERTKLRRLAQFKSKSHLVHRVDTAPILAEKQLHYSEVPILGCHTK